MDDHVIAIPLIHTAFDILMEQCQVSLKEKYNKVADVLNLSVKEENKKRLDGKLLPVFREFSSTIFPWSILKIQIITKFKTQFEEICHKKLKMRMAFNDKNALYQFLSKCCKLFISMILYSPTITLPLPKSLSKKRLKF